MLLGIKKRLRLLPLLKLMMLSLQEVKHLLNDGIIN
jgi:hypothetical protein